MSATDNLNETQFYHGSRAQLQVGDLIEPGHPQKWAGSNTNYVSFTPEFNVAHGFARRLAPGAADEHQAPRVYTVEPTGRHTKDPDFEGPARRSKLPLRITGMREVQ